MNQALKQKRDEWESAYCHCTGPVCTGCDEETQKLYRMGFDAAIAAVIELVGEFDQSGAQYFILGALYQHSEILKKIKGEE